MSFFLLYAYLTYVLHAYLTQYFFKGGSFQGCYLFPVDDFYWYALNSSSIWYYFWYNINTPDSCFLFPFHFPLLLLLWQYTALHTALFKNGLFFLSMLWQHTTLFGELVIFLLNLHSNWASIFSIANISFVDYSLPQ